MKELPVYIYRKYKGTQGCTCVKEENIKYTLTLKFKEDCTNDNEIRQSYLLFYEPEDNYFDKKPPYIGEHTGMGKDNLEELVKELKELIK